jgi:hypothetical protein
MFEQHMLVVIGVLQSVSPRLSLLIDKFVETSSLFRVFNIKALK